MSDEEISSHLLELNYHTYADGEKGNSLVNSAEGRHIDGLSADGTL